MTRLNAVQLLLLFGPYYPCYYYEEVIGLGFYGKQIALSLFRLWKGLTRLYIITYKLNLAVILATSFPGIVGGKFWSRENPATSFLGIYYVISTVTSHLSFVIY